MPVPDLATLEPFALVVAVTSFVAIRRFRLNPAIVALACGAAGLVHALVT